jgi:hypothetical protein
MCQPRSTHSFHRLRPLATTSLWVQGAVQSVVLLALQQLLAQSLAIPIRNCP